MCCNVGELLLLNNNRTPVLINFVMIYRDPPGEGE